MREIPITQGKVTLVDDEDFDNVIQYKWYTVKREHTCYVARKLYLPNGKRTTQGLHIYIMARPYIDHIDGNGLNNQRANLRPATPTQNRRNTHRRCNKFTSKYKGVYWNVRERKWRASIYINYSSVHLGCFRDENWAAQAYDAAAIEYFGEFANLNFKD